MERQDRGCCTSTASRIPIQRMRQSPPCLTLMKKQVGFAPWLCSCAGKASCSVVPCPNPTCPALPCPCPCPILALLCPGLPCPAGPALPCPALPSPALPCPALPCPALPCPALPCPALPCPALRKTLKALFRISQLLPNSHCQDLIGRFFWCCSWHSLGGDISDI